MTRSCPVTRRAVVAVQTPPRNATTPPQFREYAGRFIVAYAMRTQPPIENDNDAVTRMPELLQHYEKDQQTAIYSASAPNVTNASKILVSVLKLDLVDRNILF